MTWADVDRYAQLTKDAVSAFNESLAQYEKQIETERERELFTELQNSVKEFMEFGGNILSLATTHNEKNLHEIAKQIIAVCPVKAAKVEKAVADLIELESAEASQLVKDAHYAQDQVSLAIIFGSVAGFLLAVGLGFFVARSLSSKLTVLADYLNRSSDEVTSSARQVSDNGTKLSSAAAQQAAALQETVSAIEEIRTMISKNSENAVRSQSIASSSRSSAASGKALVEQLVSEVGEIQKSTDGLVKTVERGNDEITTIISVISEIEQKTKVINDIVFQTKLLSFNASVEAARAGESGKGFAVVAEEVGNLAQSSGKAAREIEELLTKSLQRVQDIVAKTKSSTDQEAARSKERVSRGLRVAYDCGDSLNQILEATEKVEEMAKDIAAASQEQAVGVTEVTKAMQQLDQVTHENANVSASSANASNELKTLSEQLRLWVGNLYTTVRGGDTVIESSDAIKTGVKLKSVDRHDSTQKSA